MFVMNRKTLPIKIHFGLIMAGIAPLSCFGSSIAKQMGLSENLIALIYFSLPLIAVLARVILGIIGDKFHALKVILVASLAVCASIFLSFFQFPPEHPLEDTMFLCRTNDTTIKFYDKKLNKVDDLTTCEIMCSSNDDFLKMCADWKTILGKNYTNTNFCHKLSVVINLDEKSNEKNSDVNGRIQTVFNSDYEILVPHCSVEKNASCSLLCHEERNSIKSGILWPMFWYLLILYYIFGITYYVFCTITDTICFQLIGDKPHTYGMQRVSGAFGWGFSTLICGCLIDYFSEDNAEQKNYKPLYAFSFVMLSLSTLWSLTLEVKQDEKTVFDFKKVRKLFQHFEVIVFAFWAFLSGLFQQIIWQYMFWYIQDISSADDLKRLKSLQGLLALMTTVFGDQLFYLASAYVMRKVDIGICMSLSHFLCTVRFFAYSFLTIPFLAIPIASLDGIVFGLQYVVITTYSNLISAKGTEATIQAIFNCIFDGIGTSVGGLCGGMLYGWYGGKALFRMFGFISLASCIVQFFYYHFNIGAFKHDLSAT